MAPRIPKFVPFILSFVAAILIIFVLTAGSSPGALVDISALSVPPILSTSQYLTDLTALTNVDLTGPPQTPATLKIAPLYRVYVFTCCSSTYCTAPMVGPSFDPMSNLRLSTTSLGGEPSTSLADSLSLYKVVSPILGVALILAFVAVLAAPSVKLLEGQIKSAGHVAVMMSLLSAVCVLVACVAGQVGMQRLCDGLNRDFGPYGMRTSRGPLLYPAWAALPVCLLNTAVMFASVRGTPRGSTRDRKEKEKWRAKEAPAAPPVEATSTPPLLEAPLNARSDWPLAGTEGSRIAIRNTFHEDLSDGWLSKSVLGSEDGKKRRLTGDGRPGGMPAGGAAGARVAGARSGDHDAWYVAHRQPVRMPEYRH
ncbi:uncharacterized protein DNG_01446 [Cephalotrichum gorgonifer]|uniref:SUR7 domain-containing protein n=1 Tax=Cephalotrichum gorgonifer TaxID=2041049 RepID=A0AAE8SRU9_9PEZI|nr:uncharacterized protein DNG_01446 [Cephalotrichum gorgonifer]